MNSCSAGYTWSRCARPRGLRATHLPLILTRPPPTAPQTFTPVFSFTYCPRGRNLDVLWPVFIAAGLEHVRIVPGYLAASPLQFLDYPYTHSLAAAIEDSVTRIQSGFQAGFVLLLLLCVHYFRRDIAGAAVDYQGLLHSY